MPPVFGPLSPSPTRLKSWAGASGTARAPSQSAKQRHLGPSSSSSITSGPANAARGARARRRARSGVRQTKTPLPAARPSAFTTHGGRATASGCGRRHAGRAHHLLGERLRALDPRGRRAGPEDRDAGVPQLVGDAGDERRLGPDDDEVDVERAREAEQALAVVGAHRVALAERARCRGCPARRAARQRGAWASFHASACSRPPEPTRSTFTAESTARPARDRR